MLVLSGGVDDAKSGEFPPVEKGVQIAQIEVELILLSLYHIL